MSPENSLAHAQYVFYSAATKTRVAKSKDKNKMTARAQAEDMRLAHTARIKKMMTLCESAPYFLM
jgi:hypothetical protein